MYLELLINNTYNEIERNIRNYFYVSQLFII